MKKKRSLVRFTTLGELNWVKEPIDVLLAEMKERTYDTKKEAFNVVNNYKKKYKKVVKVRITIEEL